MIRQRHIGICLFLGAALLCERCKDPYISPYKSPPTGYLVVEVIGFVSAGTVQQYRLWISREQILNTFDYRCDQDDGFIAKGDQRNYLIYFGSTYSPITSANENSTFGYTINETECLVCTSHGGTNHAPPYWPN